MSNRLDLGMYDRNDQLVLIVEVKTKLNASSKWATHLRRNMLAHGTLPHAKFFLLALPDRFYLWVDNNAQSPEQEPTYSIDPQPLLKPYFDDTGLAADRISGETFELIVASLLNKLAQLNNHNQGNAQMQPWLVEPGLLDAISGGHLKHEVAA